MGSIEDIGEDIRSNLTDIREKHYEDQNRGIYMFRLDDDRVVDATMTGGVARPSTTAATPTVSPRPWSWPTLISSSSLPGGSTGGRSCHMTTNLTSKMITKFLVHVELRIVENG